MFARLLLGFRAGLKMEKRQFCVTNLAWCLVVPILLGSSKSFPDPVLKHMCTKEYGAKFWRNFLECTAVLKSEVLDVLNSCIPVSTPEEAESTRCDVCSQPDQWIKMMNCMNMRLIELQDESNPNLELSPGMLYKACVMTLTQEADLSLQENKPFMPDDQRIVRSNCSQF